VRTGHPLFLETGLPVTRYTVPCVKGLAPNFYEEIEKGKMSESSFVSTVLREGKTLYVRRSRNQQAL